MAAKKPPAAPAKTTPKPAAKALPRGKALTAAAAPPRAPSPAPDAKTPASPTVTLKQLAAQLAEAHAMPKRQAETVTADVIGLIVDHLKAGDRLRIGGFGILEVKHRPARQGRNPATGAAIQIAASKKVAFRPAKELKEAV
jgi:DNA-binding protein HU-beta